MRNLQLGWLRTWVAAIVTLGGCSAPNNTTGVVSTFATKTHALPADAPYLLVLGIAQDGGFPQAGCARACCADAWRDPALRSGAACVAIVDPQSQQRWMIDATPSFPEQLRLLDEAVPPQGTPDLAGILLTHAHIGHYIGLMHLGREVLGTQGVPVYAMPRMTRFLEHNGPWDQLVRLKNTELRPLVADQPVRLNERISVTPLVVPHRDEYSETVGFVIRGPRRAVLYIPDVDKWQRWDRRIEDVVSSVDAAYLDGTFFADGELRQRTMAEVPHPFIVESLAHFGELPAQERAKVHFIHLNHTNPALHPDSAARKQIEDAACHVAQVGERCAL